MQRESGGVASTNQEGERSSCPTFTVLLVRYRGSFHRFHDGRRIYLAMCAEIRGLYV